MSVLTTLARAPRRFGAGGVRRVRVRQEEGRWRLLEVSSFAQDADERARLQAAYRTLQRGAR